MGRTSCRPRRERILPNFETDVGRRRGRQDVRPIVDANAGGISNESDAFRCVKVADMMRGMTGRVSNLKVARAQRQRLAHFENAQILLPTRQRFPKELMQSIWP